MSLCSIFPIQAQAAGSATVSTAHKHSSRKKRLHQTHSPRVLRLKSAFVASSDLRPMAQQLLENRTPAAYAGVEHYAVSHPQSDTGSLAWLAIGYARVLDHDPANAIDALKRAQLHAGDLSDYADYYLGSAYAATGKSDAVVATLHSFETRHPDSLLLRDAMRVYGAALAATGHAAEAVRILEKYRTPVRSEMELTVGRAYAKLGEYNQATEALRRVYYLHPLAPEAAEARAELERMAQEAALSRPTFAQRRSRADLLAQGRDYANAILEYRSLLDDAPAGERADIEISLAQALHHSGGDVEARRLLDSLSENSGEIAARRWHALAEVARSTQDEAALSEAVAQLRQIAPASESFEDSLLLAGNMYLLQKKPDRAIQFYRELAQRFPAGKTGATEHWRAAWLTFRAGNKEEAGKAFEEQITRFSRSPEVAAALYWLGRLAEDEGNAGRAHACYQKLVARFPHYYYAELARARMGVLPPSAAVHDAALDTDMVPAAAATDVSEDDKPPEDNVRYEKSRLLQNGGLTDLAVRELRNAAPEGTMWVSLEIARDYLQDGLYHRAMETLKSAIAGYYSVEMESLPRFCWEILFPRPYWEELKKHAQENGLDPYLVAALIRQESEFNPGAVSRAQAVGLMQLLPKTGKKVAHDLKLTGYSAEELLQPNYNLQLGAAYLRSVLDQFGGRLEYALAAYNAGPEHVQEWTSEGVYRGPDEFVESIPFTETREYVQAILRNAAIYRRLYGKQ